MCGALFLDQDFEALMEERIGTDIWEQIPPEEIKTMMNQAWEHGIKQQFDGNEPENKVWRVLLPPTCAQLTREVGINIPRYVLSLIR